MFGLFKVKPPLSPWEKAWAEHRLSWLVDQLGFERILETETLVPDDSRIPQVTDQREASDLLGFLGEWMKINTSGMRLQVYRDVVSPEQLETPGQDEVALRIHESQLADRDLLVASLAWQLAHEMIARGTLQHAKQSDQAWTTDLLPAFFGLGIFGVNYTLRKPEPAVNHFTWWGKRQRAYLPARVFGYALALREAMRGGDASWGSYLRPDARLALQEGLKYLEKTQDTTFSREAVRQDRSRLPVEALLDELRTGTPSRKISAIWELSPRAGQLTEAEQRAVAELLMDELRSKEPELRAVAASTLALFDRSAHAAQDIADALRDSSDEVRIAAAGALGDFVGVDDATLVHDLQDALKDGERLVVFSAARSLTRFGDAAQPAVKYLLKRMRQALVNCRDDDALLLLATIDAISGDGQQRVQEFFGEDEPEYQNMAMQLWEQLETPAA